MNLASTFSKLTRIQSLPLVKYLAPAVNRIPREEEIESYLQCQRLSVRAVKEISSLVTEGWTEIQAAEMIETYLRDLGVKAFFHLPFAWFGERSKFDGMRTYREAMPTDRRIKEGEVFILDVAPIYAGVAADVGYTACLGENAEFLKAQNTLSILRAEIPALFDGTRTGKEIWKEVETKLSSGGFSNAYQMYPYAVLGHRVHRASELASSFHFLNMGWQSYWGFLSRGVWGQLLGPHYEGDLTGLWAIEPHLSAQHFGAKFEEILLVEPGSARWIETDAAKASL